MRCYMGKNIAFWKLILKIPLCQWSDWGKRNYWWINAVHLHLWQVASVPSALSVISLRVWRGGGRRPAWWWYDGAVSRAGLVPCLHCVLLLSTDVHIHTLPPRALSSDSYPPAAINLGPAQLGGWGNPSGQKSWTQIVVIASPYRYLGPGTELAQLYCARCFRPLQASIGKT